MLSPWYCSQNDSKTNPGRLPNGTDSVSSVIENLVSPRLHRGQQTFSIEDRAANTSWAGHISSRCFSSWCPLSSSSSFLIIFFFFFLFRFFLCNPLKTDKSFSACGVRGVPRGRFGARASAGLAPVLLFPVQGARDPGVGE